MRRIALKIKSVIIQSEEEKMAMERKVMQVEEQAANLLKTTQQREIEADLLRRELERAKVEQSTRQQLVVSGGGSSRPQNSSPLQGVSNNVCTIHITLVT